MTRFRTVAARAVWVLGLLATLATSAAHTYLSGSSEWRELTTGETVHVVVRPNEKAQSADAYEIRVAFEEPLPPGFRLKVVPDDRPPEEPQLFTADDAEDGYQGLGPTDRELVVFMLPLPARPCDGADPCELGYSLELAFEGEEGVTHGIQVDAHLTREGDAGCLQMNPPGFDDSAEVTVGFDD